MVLLYLTCLTGIALTFRDYGITWDEGVQARYGELCLDYFLSGLRDTSYEGLFNLKYYGALFEMLCSAVYRYAGTDPFVTRHFCIAITGLLTVVAVTLVGRIWRDPWVSIYAGLALVMIPRFYGDSFNNSKDVPFACAFAWAMLAISHLVGAPRVSWRHTLAAGAAIGVALALRMGGLLLFGITVALLAAKIAARPWTEFRIATRNARSAFATARGPTLKFLAAAGVAWTVMVAAWPWAHSNPLINPLIAFRQNLNFQLFKEVLYGGKIVYSTDIPRSYLPWYLLITLPLPLVCLALIGVGVVVRGWLRDPGSVESLIGLAVLIWFLGPVLYFVIARPTVYDGIRHFLFVLPPVAVLAAVGAARIQAHSRSFGPIVVLLTLVAIGWPIPDMVTLHPYQTTYFNGLVGGVAGASGRYDTEYWASSYKEAAAWINTRAREDGDRPLNVLVAGNEFSLPCFAHYTLPNVHVRMVEQPGIPGRLPSGIDYYVALTRRRFDQNFPESPVVHVIGRDGAVFTVVRARS